MQVEGGCRRDECQAQVEPQEDERGQRQTTDEREREPGGEVERNGGGQRGDEEAPLPHPQPLLCPPQAGGRGGAKGKG